MNKPTGWRKAVSKIAEFNQFRENMNDIILAEDNRAIKRMYGLDTVTYQDGALPARTKELLGLVTSAVLRCDDCITYHLIQCQEEGYTKAELYDAMSVALTVGGSILIPHLRRAAETLEELYPSR